MFGMLLNTVAGALTSSTLNLTAISNIAAAAQEDSFDRLEVWAAGSLRFGNRSQAGTIHALPRTVSASAWTSA